MNEVLTAAHEFDAQSKLEIDGIGHECGLVGVYAPGKQAGVLAHKLLRANQHRGQDAAGITVGGPNALVTYKSTGLLTDVLPDEAVALSEVAEGAPVAIGQVRYGTIKASSETESEQELNFRAAQPILAPSERFALGHNGHIEPSEEAIQKYGINPADCVSDTEWLIKTLDAAAGPEGDVVDALHEVLPLVDGAYSLIITDGTRLIGVRDRHGFRPLSLGTLPDGPWVLSSETAALDMYRRKLGSRYERDVQPGEIVIVGENGVTSESLDVEVDPKLCAFEFVYIARQESNLVDGSINVHLARERMGTFLHEDYPIEADMVVGIPESGMSAASGFAKASGIPLEVGAVIKNRYVPRTFLNENQTSRRDAVDIKFQVNEAVVYGQRIVLVDDSIVRGNTTEILIEKLKDAGAAEVHVRVPSPPYRWPCFYGVDTGKPEELVAVGRTEAEIAAKINATSLACLTPARLEQAIREAALETPGATQKALGGFCMACATGNYETAVPVRLRPFVDAQKQLLGV